MSSQYLRDDPEQLRSFQREVTLFRLLKDSLGDHPHIVHILDWSFDEAPYFIEVEYVRGGDLLQWSQKKGGVENVAFNDRLPIAPGPLKRTQRHSKLARG